MADERSVPELRAKLVERREEHKAALREIEDGLSRLDRLIALAYPEEATRPREVRTVGLPKAAKAAGQALPTLQEEGMSERFLDIASGKAEPFDIRIKEEVRDRYGLEVDDKQASNALRNLVKRGKLRLWKPGGPRKPALYVTLDYTGPEADADEGEPESPLFTGAEE